LTSHIDIPVLGEHRSDTEMMVLKSSMESKWYPLQDSLEESESEDPAFEECCKRLRLKKLPHFIFVHTRPEVVALNVTPAGNEFKESFRILRKYTLEYVESELNHRRYSRGKRRAVTRHVPRRRPDETYYSYVTGLLVSSCFPPMIIISLAIVLFFK